MQVSEHGHDEQRILVPLLLKLRHGRVVVRVGVVGMARILLCVPPSRPVRDRPR